MFVRIALLVPPEVGKRLRILRRVHAGSGGALGPCWGAPRCLRGAWGSRAKCGTKFRSTCRPAVDPCRRKSALLKSLNPGTNSHILFFSVAFVSHSKTCFALGSCRVGVCVWYAFKSHLIWCVSKYVKLRSHEYTRRLPRQSVYTFDEESHVDPKPALFRRSSACTSDYPRLQLKRILMQLLLTNSATCYSPYAQKQKHIWWSHKLLSTSSICLKLSVHMVSRGSAGFHKLHDTLWYCYSNIIRLHCRLIRNYSTITLRSNSGGF